jgi:hypothetical protein
MIVPSKAIAAVDVADRQGEEDDTDRQHDDIHHGKCSGRGSAAPSAISGGMAAGRRAAGRLSPIQVLLPVIVRI